MPANQAQLNELAIASRKKERFRCRNMYLLFNCVSPLVPPDMARNPIIFARTETTHIPVSLDKTNVHTDLRNAIYSVEEDGTLKTTQLPTICEEEEEKRVSSEKPKLPVSILVICYVVLGEDPILSLLPM